MSKQAILAARWAEMQAGGAKGKVKRQGTLDGAVQKVKKPARFTPAAILLNVTKHVVCHDQVRISPLLDRVTHLRSRHHVARHPCSLPILLRHAHFQCMPRATRWERRVAYVPSALWMGCKAIQRAEGTDVAGPPSGVRPARDTARAFTRPGCARRTVSDRCRCDVLWCVCAHRAACFLGAQRFLGARRFLGAQRFSDGRHFLDRAQRTSALCAVPLRVVATLREGLVRIPSQCGLWPCACRRGRRVQSDRWRAIHAGGHSAYAQVSQSPARPRSDGCARAGVAVRHVLQASG